MTSVIEFMGLLVAVPLLMGLLSCARSSYVERVRRREMLRNRRIAAGILREWPRSWDAGGRDWVLREAETIAREAWR